MANNGHGLGFEAKLWLTADKLRNNMDAAAEKKEKYESGKKHG